MESRASIRGMEKICPFLGLKDDPDTSLSFPSLWNYCHRSKPIAVVRPEHQRNYCLADEYGNCPVYIQDQEAPLPLEIRAYRIKPIRKDKPVWKVVLVLLVVILIGGLVGLQILVQRPLSFSRFTGTPTPENTATFLPSPSSTPIKATKVIFTPTQPEIISSLLPFPSPFLLFPSHSPTRTPTLTPSPTRTPTLTPSPTRTPTFTPSPTRTPTLTPSPTRTPIPSLAPTIPAPTSSATQTSHALDTPIGSKYKFIIHKVVKGESLQLYAEKYGTTIETIRAVNYHLPIPLWEDWLIIIPISITDAQGLPSFEAYMVSEEGLTIAELARKLSTDPIELKYYNALGETYRSSSGDCLLIPREKSIPPVPTEGG